MDRVAERAGVGKAALYRRWPSKREMLIDRPFTTSAVLPPDTGSLRGDILTLAEDTIALLANPLIRLEIAQDLIGGPLYLRGITLGEEFPPHYAERLTDAVPRSLGAT